MPAINWTKTLFQSIHQSVMPVTNCTKALFFTEYSHCIPRHYFRQETSHPQLQTLSSVQHVIVHVRGIIKQKKTSTKVCFFRVQDNLKNSKRQNQVLMQGITGVDGRAPCWSEWANSLPTLQLMIMMLMSLQRTNYHAFEM